MILIGLGSNLTTEEFPTSSEIVSAALKEMEKAGLEIQSCSSFYETEPVPKSDQPWFINAVASVKTGLNADKLLKLLHSIEQTLGRTRRERWEARVIDLDLLGYNEQVFPSLVQWKKAGAVNLETDMIVPHIRMHERDFVLIPLKEIAPGWKHPVFLKNAEQLLKEQKSTGIVRKI